MERRIVQALFEQIWWQVTGDAERRRDAVARVELLQQQLAVHRQQRPPWPCKGPV